MDTLLQVAGGLVVLTVLADVFFTVLAPGSGHGPIRKPLSRFVWHGFRMAARISGPARRRSVLAYCGPGIITITIAVWPVILACGWAMIYLPALGSGLTASGGPTPHDWPTAFYYSGFSATTLGTGDITPQTDLYRFLTVTEAAVGFAVITMVLTYFLSVYGAITSRKTFAATLHHRTLDTGDSIELIRALANEDDITAVLEELSSTGQFLQQVYESHRSYPVLRYFHFTDTRYALPRLLAIVLDAAALLASALDTEQYPRLAHSPALALIDGAARDLLSELVPHALNDGGRPLDPDWSVRFAAASKRLSAAGLCVRTDPEAGEDYRRWRQRWDLPLHALTRTMLYDWAEIQPGND